MNMPQNKYSKKVILTATEISTISINLRESVKKGKKKLKNAKKEEIMGIKEYLEKTSTLQKRFQRLAVKIEKEILEDIRKS